MLHLHLLIIKGAVNGFGPVREHSERRSESADSDTGVPVMKKYAANVINTRFMVSRTEAR
jgi:hypothetical protein